VDPASYLVVDRLNDIAWMEFDLRYADIATYYSGRLEYDFIKIASRLYRGGSFLDVGSSIGLYAICLAPKVFEEGGRFVSIEPLSFNLARQRRNLELNGLLERVEIVQAACGSKPGFVNISADPQELHGNAFVHPEGQHRIEVTLIDILAAKMKLDLGFIKIDIEGYDPEALAGARETIARQRPVLFVEFNRERMDLNGFDMAPSWEFLIGARYRAFEVASAQLRELHEPGRSENLFFLQDRDIGFARSAGLLA
jgi:FkbM family methyltransferase